MTFTLPKKRLTIVSMSKMTYPNIVLIGFMGTGKSAVADYLSVELGFPIIDIDQVISNLEKKSIVDIFATHGEAYFRDVESRILSQLTIEKNTIISCGGGIVMTTGNIEKLKEIGFVVLLTASPRTVLRRVEENDERPLLTDRMNIGFVTELMEQRREHYRRAADIVIDTDDKSVSQVGDELLEQMRRKRYHVK